MTGKYARKDIVALCARACEEVGGVPGITDRLERSVDRAMNSPGHTLERGGGDRGGTLWTWRPPFKPDEPPFFEYRDENAALAFAVLFLDGPPAQRVESGRAFIAVLRKMADIRLHIDVLACDRAWEQTGMTNLCHAWRCVREHEAFPEVCMDDDRKRVEGWMSEHARLMLRDRDAQRWASFRPYDNQEIGVGCLVAEAQVLADTDPELSSALMDLADQRVIGWPEKSGNADDTLFYSSVWSRALYLYASCRGHTDWFRSVNCRNTFEAFLQQQPASGPPTVYNQPYVAPCPDHLALGAHLFHDGRYKWMAERMLTYRVEKREELTRHVLEETRDLKGDAWLARTVRERAGNYDLIWEGRTSNLFHLWLFWDDDLEPQKPSDGSCVLYKTLGATQGRDPANAFGEPGPSLADKIVLRDGWEEDSLFALLNVQGRSESPLRQAEAHRYPGTNEVISVVFGEPFAIHAVADPQTGAFEPRDEAIQRRWLNALWLREDGRWLASDKIRHEPFQAEVAFFESLKRADFCRTVMPPYQGWTQERTCILVRGECLAVFDHCSGPERDVGVLWHLKGEREDLPNGVDLRLGDRRMSVFWPLAGTRHAAEVRENCDAPPFYEYKASLDVALTERGERAAFATLFRPNRGRGVPEVREVVVKTVDGDDAYPLAMGIALKGEEECLLGARTRVYPSQYLYEGMRIDAEAFVMWRKTERMSIDFVNGRSFRLPDIGGNVRMNGQSLAAECFSRLSGSLVVELPGSSSGTLAIGR